ALRREGRCGGGGEKAGRAEGRAPGVAQITTRILEPRKTLPVIEPIFGDAHVAERAARAALGVSQRHALRLEAVDFHLDVRLNLVLEVALRASAEHQDFLRLGL